jgi:inosine/xanthosine triphosphatase
LAEQELSMPLRIVVGSKNPVKVKAVATAFERALGHADLEVLAISVPSDVGDQPRCDQETRTGAGNRARNARTEQPDADYWVGLEGGLERIDSQWLASAWMVVLERTGRTGEARTVTLPLPPAVQRLLDSGMELGDANDQVFATHNSKQAGGAFGLLTEGRMTRGSVYSQTVELALMPLLHELWQS